MHDWRKKNLTKEMVAVTGYSIDALRAKLFPEGEGRSRRHKHSKIGDTEVTRTYLEQLEDSENENERKQYETVLNTVADPDHQNGYWSGEGGELIEDPQSSSSKELTNLSVTTWIMISIFLFENLLTLSLMSYVLNGVPFFILIYLTCTAVTFDHSGKGFEKLLSLRSGSSWDFLDMDMWKEAVIQALYTSGIGNGVLISLSTFNNLHHNYLKYMIQNIYSISPSTCYSTNQSCSLQGCFLDTWLIACDFILWRAHLLLHHRALHNCSRN